VCVYIAEREREREREKERFRVYRVRFSGARSRPVDVQDLCLSSIARRNAKVRKPRLAFTAKTRPDPDAALLTISLPCGWTRIASKREQTLRLHRRDAKDSPGITLENICPVTVSLAEKLVAPRYIQKILIPNFLRRPTIIRNSTENETSVLALREVPGR